MKKVGGFAVGIFVTQAVIEMFSRRYEEDFSSFHEHDHWPGYLLMLLRVVAALLTCRGAGLAYKKVNKTDENAAMFVKLFAGTAYLYV